MNAHCPVLRTRRAWTSAWNFIGLGAMAIVLALAGAAPAVERFPPPDFTDHVLPQLHQPPADSAWFEVADLAYLFLALTLATYLGLVRRSRKGLLVLSVVSLAWLGFWRGGCVCPIGAIQNVALALADRSYAIPATVLAVFALPVVFTLFFGRTFCSAVCPLGALQEVACVWPVRVPRWLEQGLGLVAYAYLGAAVVFAATGVGFLICRYDPFVGFFRLSGSTNMLIMGGSLLVIGLFVGRPYCRFLCPLGALLRICSKVACWHVRIPPAECSRCRLCEDACPYGAIQPPEPSLEAAQRPAGRRRLAAALVLAPVLLVAGAWLGQWLGVPFSKLDTEVQLAERVRGEETGRLSGTTDASDAFRNTGRSRYELYASATARAARMADAGMWLGGWMGLVVGLKLVALAIRRRQDDYRPDQGQCVSCARCFLACPHEQARLGLIEELPVIDQPASKELQAHV